MRALALLLFLLATPVAAQTRCDTFQDIGDGLYFQDQSVRGTLYGEADARGLVESLLDHTDPGLYPPAAIADLRKRTVYVGIFVSRGDPRRSAIISFFDADRCRFAYTAIDPAAIPVLLREMTGGLIPAHFHELADDDPINLWLARQYSMDGGFCCSGADAYAYDGSYTTNPDGSVTVPLDGGGTRVIPFDKTVRIPVDAFGRPTDPNPTGGAVWWKSADGRQIYCWAFGPLV